MAQVEPMRTEAESLGERGRTSAGEGDADHLEMIRRLVVRFGRYAESLFDYHDFGFPREVVGTHIANLESEIRRLQALGSDDALGIPREVLREDVQDAWNSKKNLQHAAGALMISERFRNEIRPENRLHAISMKVLYECFLDTVDDLIDAGVYSFSDALDLMRHCLGAVTAQRFEEPIFRDELSARLAPEQRHLTDLLTALAATLHRNFRNSPHGASLAGELERLQENWILGEAYTMYQKDPTVDVRAFVTAGSQFPAPDPEMSGWERLSGWISHTAALTLIDMCFMD